MSSNNPTAGSAEPYWFEWKTGLLRLVELLDEDSEVVAVAFQLHGTKGWDDVGIRFSDGRTQLLQMKHSRKGDRLTFGDLVTPESEHSPSLLRALAGAWKNEKDTRGAVECFLVTNRRAGTNWYQGRPPLEEFLDKLKRRVKQAASLDEVCWEGEDDRYPRAWEIFMAELNDLKPEDELAFLQSLNISVDAPDLDALEAGIRQRLTALTGLPLSSINGLFNALLANLRKWTCQTRREKEWIDREALGAYLAGDEDAPPWLGHCEVETPEPFFPSREVVVDFLRTSLLSGSAHKVDFLSAEPGGGKTSCISKLARSGAVLWKEQCVSIRFYAYRPIRPGQPDVGGDSGIGVRPEALWLALLWQIRDHLRKTHLLAELRVPVWLDEMPWEIARAHVLRIAEALGSRWGRCFVVCIDGIDHAARARRKQLPEFLQTLPSPDAIPRHVRFLLAGQPADAYPEYPFFLRQAHDAVKVHPLDTLMDEDIRVLWRAAKPLLPRQAEDSVIRLLAEKTQRRTLPTVYAVEDIRTIATLEEVASVLNARPLADSLHNYYEAIWSTATATAGDGPRLAATFALLRERPTGAVMASAYPELERTAAEWTDIMRRLRPLVRETAEGFEVLHNDLRVHLDARLANEPFVRKEVASAFVYHYRKSTSNRFAAHLSILDLLTTAERRMEFADDFTVNWVIEAGALGFSNEVLAIECSAAFLAVVARQDWLLLHSVACASLTVHRLHESLSNSDHEHNFLASKIAPTFVPVEGEPLPFELWSAGDFSELVTACQQLMDCGAKQRAALVLKQWVGGISVEALVEQLVESAKGENKRNDEVERLRQKFEQFGRLCALCRLPLVSSETDTEKNSGYRAAIENGWVLGLAQSSNRREALRRWCSYRPRYLVSWVSAAKEAAHRSRWGEVRALLARLERCAGKIGATDRLMLGWIATRARLKNASIWQQPFMQPNYGLAEGNTPLATLRMVAQWITYTSPIREPTQVVEDLVPLLAKQNLESKNISAIRLLLGASAVTGRLLRYRDLNDFVGAGTSVPPATLAPLLRALWCVEPDWRNLPHDEVQTPGEIGSTLAKIAWECGTPYRQLLCSIAKERFPNTMLWNEGLRLFDILWECGEHVFLNSAVATKAREVLDHLHETDASSRNIIIANLVHFTTRLEMRQVAKELADRFRRTRIGYSSSKEWVFLPLVRWFGFARKNSPSAWNEDGTQLLALDRICEQQGGDNGFSAEVIAEVGAGAMECGPDDFEALFGLLVTREAKHPFWNLAKAAQDGFKVCLKEQHTMSEESALARVAIAIALGRWPQASALSTVSAFLNAHGVPRSFSEQPAWKKAVRLAAEMQGVQAQIKPGESSDAHRSKPTELRNTETILQEIIQPKDSSWLRLRDIASLAEQARAENHPNRDGFIATALGALEFTEAFSRCIEYHDIDLMSRLYHSLNESERWRLLGAITAVTGERRKEMSDSNWAFMVAFSAVDLACYVRATDAGDVAFGSAVFHQLIEGHWKWHGIPVPMLSVEVSKTPSTWPDAARRMLLSLTQTDACETLYMAMSGLRFFAEVFPDQIPIICRAGLADEHARDAILALAQLWATRHPHELTPALNDFAAHETTGTLEERLDGWAVGALHDLINGKCPRTFPLSPKDETPDIVFPGDGPLFDGEAQINGLTRHNTFAQMANNRLRRVGMALGSMDGAYRHMARKVKSGTVTFPPMILSPPKKLAFDSSSPRQRHKAEHIVGDAILHQYAGRTWSPAKAAAVRLLIGYGMDPWVATATPNIWPDKQVWPSDFDVERWIEAGASKTDDVGVRLTALLEGHDLAPSLLLLGAVLHIPTYRRDLQFYFWLAAQTADGVIGERNKTVSPAGRTLAGWLAGWSFAVKPSEKTAVHFVGALVNYPNGDLDITPTDEWTKLWGWHVDSTNNLRFRSKNGSIVAWHERWLGPDTSSRHVCRQPILNRWVARRNGFPVEYDDLRAWGRRTDFASGPLSVPE